MEAPKPSMANPYVFIVGCPRSGTTLLQRIVNAHPQIAILPESHWIPRFFEKRTGLTPEGFVTPELIDQLFDQLKFADLQMSRKELEGLLGAGEPVPYSDFIERIFDWYGKARGKALVGNKTPGFVRRISTVHSLWPQARFVHLIRDGRDVYLSTRHRPLKHPKPGVFDTWGEDPASTAALWWELNVRLGRQAAGWLGSGLYYEMRYELLVSRPGQECAELCAFLGVAHDGAMLRFYENETRPKAAQPILPGLRDWRSQMPGDEVERFEAVAGKVLGELAYPLAVPCPAPDNLQRASRIRDSFARNPRNLALVRELTRATPQVGLP